MTLTKLNHKIISEKDMMLKSQHYLNEMKSRRSVRHFSDKSIPLGAIKNIIMTASSAPSGANKQPWKFIVLHSII